MVISFWEFWMLLHHCCASLLSILRKISWIWPFPLLLSLNREQENEKVSSPLLLSALVASCFPPRLTGRSRTYTPSCLSAARPTTPRPRRLPPSATWVIGGSAVAPAARVYSVAIRFCRQVADNRLPNCGKLFTVRLSAPRSSGTTSRLTRSSSEEETLWLPSKSKEWFQRCQHWEVTGLPPRCWMTDISFLGRTGLHVSEPSDCTSGFDFMYIDIYINTGLYSLGILPVYLSHLAVP